MADNVSDFLLERLREWGVERIYGYPGDGINGILGALNRAKTTRCSFSAARRNGRLYGDRTREVYTKARGVSGYFRPRGDSLTEWAV